MTRKPRLSLEALEAKDLLSPGPPIPLGISLNSFGTLYIKGDSRHETARVWIAADGVHARLGHTTYVSVPGGDATPLTLYDPEKVFALAQVKHISFAGYEGNDSFTNDTGIGCTATGGDGRDSLIGGSGNDLLVGNAGDDTLEGRRGDDDLRGDTGDDTYVFRSPGYRVMTPQSLGTDQILEDAYADADTLDFSALGGGVTINLASTASQVVKPGILTLTLSDGLGVENVIGTSGADTITGNARANVVQALGGNDNVTGAAGDDILYGGDGNDILTGNGGNDSLYGGNGNDTLDPGTDINFVADGAGNDKVDFHLNAVGINYTTGGGNDSVVGTMFDDRITGSSGNDSLQGGFGDDSLNGGWGNDRLVGDWGDNTIHDGPGNDTIDFSYNWSAVNYTTEGGNDKVIGSSYDDVITGSSGNDSLYGGPGNDRLFGKAGWDALYGQDGNDWMEAGSAAQIADGGAGTDYNAHQWALNGATYDDVKQAGEGTCVFLSALSGAAMQGINLAGRITYQGNYTYKVKLYNADTGNARYETVHFDGGILMDGSTRLDPWSAESGEFWTILYQRAYLDMMSDIDEDFHDPDYAMYALTHRCVEDGDFDEPGHLAAALAAGKVVTAGDADDTEKVYAHHSYTVMDVYRSGGTWYIKIRNPWGKDVNASDIAAGTHVAYGSNDDGIIVLTWNSFGGYHDFDRLSIS